MNQTSRHIVNCVRDLNGEQGRNVAAYSIDAGFHVFLFCLKQNADLLKARLQSTAAISENLERIIETTIDPEGVELA